MAGNLKLVQARPSGEAGGSKATPESAFRRYAPYVAAVARRLLGHQQDVEDVVQDVFVEALRYIESIRNPKAVRSWLAAVTVRVVSKRLKRHKRRSWIGLESSAAAERVVAPGATPEQLALLNRVYASLEHVAVADRVAWALRYVQGEQLEQVADACGCSLATAKRRIARAQRHVEKELAL